MCVCVKARSPEPDRPQQNRYEPGDDLELLVGTHPSWRFSARRDALAAASPVFDAQFHGPLATNESTIIIPDLDPRAFEVLLGYVNGKAVKFGSVTTALCTFTAAHKYLISGLVQQSTEYLSRYLTPESVLDVYVHVRQYSFISKSPSREFSSFQPSAPPEEDVIPEPPGISKWSSVLLSRCLDYIDEHGEVVLNQETLEDLQPDALREILGRDTLQCNELAVLAAIQRWADRECRRKCLEPLPSNLRLVLSDLLYLVRFPRLTVNEFVQGPCRCEILTPAELHYFSNVITSQPATPPDSLKPYLSEMMRPRSFKKESSVESNSSQKRSKGWLKSKNTKPEKSHKTDKSKRCSGSCIAEGLLDAWIFLFD